MKNPEITIQLSQSDYLKGLLVAARWTTKRWIIMGTMGAIYLGLGFFMVTYAPPAFFILGWAMIGAVVGGVAGSLISRYVFLPRRLRSRFIDHKILHRSSTLSWSEKGLNIESEISRALIPWTDFFKFRESDDFVLLYTSRVLFLILPKRFFSNLDQLNDLMILVRRRIGTPRGSQSISDDRGDVA